MRARGPLSFASCKRCVGATQVPPPLDWGPGLECAAQLDPSLLQLGTVSPHRLRVPRWGPGAAARAAGYSLHFPRGPWAVQRGAGPTLGPGGRGCAARGRHRGGHRPQRAGYCPGAAGWARVRAASARSLHPARPRAPPAGRRRPAPRSCSPKRRGDPGPSHPEFSMG